MNRILLLVFFFHILWTTGCRENRNQDQPQLNSASAEVYTEVELRNLITEGMSMSEVKNRFGIPDSEIPTGNMTVLLYSFSSLPTQGESHLAGFKVQMKEGKVVRWSPITRSSHRMFQTPQESQSEISYGKRTFELFTIASALTNVLKSFESRGSEATGNLETTPDLILQAEAFAGTINRKSSTNVSVRLLIGSQDIPRLKAFTEKNAGKRILIVIDKKVFAAPLVTAPVTSDQFQFTTKHSDFLRVFRTK